MAGQTGTAEEEKKELPVTGKQEAADSRKVAISVKNLYKIYRVGEMKVRALDGVDFEIYKGGSWQSSEPPDLANQPS